MIYFNINLRYPGWWKRFANIKNCFWKTPWKHKYLELQVIKNDNLFRFEFEWTVRQDHAGVNLELGLFGYEVHFTFYDSRHWDPEEGRWMSYIEGSTRH